MSDRTEFVEAVKAQSFETDAGRIVHCMGSFTSADWAEAAVIDIVERAVDVQWSDHFMGHDLAVLNGLLWRFAVTRPAGSA